MTTPDYRCFACDARFTVSETPEPSYGLWPSPHECPACGAPVHVFYPATDMDARRLITAATGIARVSATGESVSDVLRARCITPEQVDRILATVERLDWDGWLLEFERYASNPSTAEWNRRSQAMWPDVLRSRDDGSLRRTLQASATEVKNNLRLFAAKWKPRRNDTPMGT